MKEQSLYMAMELSNKNWKLGFSNGEKTRITSVGAGEFFEFNQAISKAIQKLKLPEDVAIISCYEAGRDGFWIDRYLKSKGITNFVIDSSSIEVSRSHRRVKTDRVDTKKLVNLLMRYCHGEKEALRVVTVPTVEQEDERRLDREYDRLKRESSMHKVRIISLLKLHNITQIQWKALEEDIEDYSYWDGEKLKENTKNEILREVQRYRMVNEQLKEVEKQREEKIRNPRTESEKKAQKLQKLKAVGEVTSFRLALGFFYKEFRNRKQVGSCAGLTGTPYDSGDLRMDQGISKSGNANIRSSLIELAWLWVRYQPESAITKWWEQRFANEGKRLRRIGIAAVARKLIIALWRYVEKDEIPVGAILKPSIV
jgi:transposase